jgi:hypothetical protein
MIAGLLPRSSAQVRLHHGTGFILRFISRLDIPGKPSVPALSTAPTSSETMVDSDCCRRLPAPHSHGFRRRRSLPEFSSAHCSDGAELLEMATPASISQRASE